MGTLLFFIFLRIGRASGLLSAWDVGATTGILSLIGLSARVPSFGSCRSCVTTHRSPLVTRSQPCTYSVHGRPMLFVPTVRTNDRVGLEASLLATLKGAEGARFQAFQGGYRMSLRKTPRPSTLYSWTRYFLHALVGYR
ncbi:hypothetical protein BDV29DRAFT_128125 [Aspergillus leporis]|uniref:Secreted protein n=1 Tax=Aspergillus leporis TaxID=41062 RepID=A0A5N5WZV2_9EURO|nr:hypothetical protein BDV29DRAFT_128125 [Aspergillus leporis]